MLRRPVIVALVVCALLVQSLTAIAQQPQPTPQPAPAATPQQSSPPKDPNDPIERIKDEGMNRSQVMQTLGYLTDVIGPRLTNSPGMMRANEWTRGKLTEWGLQNAQLEAWGPFGRGWTLKSFSAQVTEPVAFPLIAYPKAWSPGIKGTLTADAVYVDAKTEADLEKYKGKLKGAVVLMSAPPQLKANFEPLGTRRDEKNLLRLADAPDPATAPRASPFQLTPEQRAEAMLLAKKYQFFTDEGAALMVEASRKGDGGAVFVQGAIVPQPFVENPFAPPAPGAPKRPSPWDANAPRIVPQLVLASDQYNRLVRIIQAGQRVRVAVNLDVEFQDKDLMGYNTVAEIPGTDLKDEIVMLGAHMDSWHAGTGATDNAAGVAVAMEAVRILQALKLRPRRTIRIALWSGEEQGLLGSRYYVMKHFGKFGDGSIESFRFANFNAGTPQKLTTLPEHEKLSGYFNLDNGTGKIRGVYMQGNEAVRPIFRQWLTPFRDLGASTLSIANTGGTDHLSFDAVGLPGFQFIQDEVEYSTRTHHSNQDVFDRIQADDMKQAATVMAAFVYNTAMRDEKLPRKPMPAQQQ
ncbi:MAG TPA: M20/M25/M40 family metallo-hydrolase [Pyrinomonadaceae bacterium]|nr:M20/M25/M40 family metallo-hydrolase [Pyrinomonadaceae bacterium]